jgi:hypothetical protein
VGRRHPSEHLSPMLWFRPDEERVGDSGEPDFGDFVHGSSVLFLRSQNNQYVTPFSLSPLVLIHEVQLRKFILSSSSGKSMSSTEETSLPGSSSFDD